MEFELFLVARLPFQVEEIIRQLLNFLFNQFYTIVLQMNWIILDREITILNWDDHSTIIKFNIQHNWITFWTIFKTTATISS